MAAVFIACVVFVGYTYVGHPLLLYCLAKLKPNAWLTGPTEYSAAVFVSALNEEQVIEEKIKNLLSQDFDGRYEILIASDGSVDRTVEIAEAFSCLDSRVRVFAFPENRGKSAMQNSIVPGLDCDLLVFSDATSMWEPDTLRRIVRSFADPDVGCLGVDLVFIKRAGGAVERGQGAYWRYESSLRRWGALVRTNIVVSGTCYAMRRDLFKDVPADVGDDLASPLQAVAAGKRVVFDPTIAVEEVSNVAHDSEARMRRRVALQNVVALTRYWRFLNPQYGFAAYQLLVHKYMRAFCWAAMLAAFVLNLLMAGDSIYLGSLVGQIMFYGLAVVGLWRHQRGKPAGPTYVPYYFSLLNFSYAVAFVQFLTGERKATWEPERDV